ncbi:hypothetical protein ES332_D09G118400v1 [Gossypium tomentosum]|uniref:Ribosomal eL28/Mak16 domain-containing protein n=1 Tax=Gossypium tomentosum TaxID=34277 RepID=A0A5D2JI41_GOSTO|nr:hypothetical protein ES332_D09G118400v1 [Gossypium tomentosum]
MVMPLQPYSVGSTYSVLIWEVVKKNNCFLVRQFGRGTASLQFSKKPNNLYNLHSYKHSGLANKKTITIQSGGKDQSMLLPRLRMIRLSYVWKEIVCLRSCWKPFLFTCHSSINFPGRSCSDEAITCKKDLFVGFFYEVTDNYYRPDLTKAALATLSAVHRSLKVAKSGVKKRNRQALKVRGRK